MSKKVWLMAVAMSLIGYACGGGEPAPAPETSPAVDTVSSNARSRFAGAWALTRIERRDANGELTTEPIENRLGYIIYDTTGHMGVTLMRPGREPYSEDGPTPDEALAQLGSYTSYFGQYSVNETKGLVTHHLEGTMNPGGAGADFPRFFTLEDDRLILQPPPSEDGARSFITWERLPDLPTEALTETHRRLFGLYRIEAVSRETSEGEPVDADQYEAGYIIYAPSGHMSVHLMRPDRQPYVADEPTPEEALAAVRGYASYFGPFSVHETEGYLIHHRIGNEDPAGTGTDAQRFYELTDTHLMLRPPPTTDDEGRKIQSTIHWARVTE